MIDLTKNTGMGIGLTSLLIDQYLWTLYKRIIKIQKSLDELSIYLIT